MIQKTLSKPNRQKFLSLFLMLITFLSWQTSRADLRSPTTSHSSIDIQLKAIGAVMSNNRSPIANVTITEKGTNNSTLSDSDGRFSLTISSPNAILVIRSLGYETKEIPYSENLQVYLNETEDILEEVVVVGYGAQRKSDLTGSIATVQAKELENINSPNIIDKLQGKVSGLLINSGSANPGNVASINIRGENSISASNSPLIILDGIPFSGSLGDISSNNIASVSVLKDASSTAIYGSRAANGVILITSKTGRSGKPSLSYNGYFGIQNVERRLNLMNGAQYIDYMRDYQISKGKIGEELDPEKYLFANVLEQYKEGIEIDWQDVIFNKSAPITEHQLSFSGGGESSDYFASVSYLSQEGVVKNSPYERFNFQLNVNQKLSEWLKMGLTVQGSLGQKHGVLPSIDNAVKMSPYGKNLDDNGNPVTYPMYAQTLYPHPFANDKGINDNTRRTVYANTYVDIQLPIEGLSFKTTFGTNYLNRAEESYYGSNTLSGQGVGGRGKVYNNNFYDWTWENLLTYENVWGNHRLNAVGLYSAQATREKWSDLSGEEFVADVGYDNLGSAAKNQIISSGLKNTAMISYMARFNYAYKDTYLLTLTGRSDGYSAFSPDQRYAFFPSASAAWVISNESFFSSENINHLKLRVSYGKNGNQAVSPYQTYNRLSNIDYIFGSEPVKGLIMPFDGRGAKLTWESTSSVNTGIDFGFLHNKIAGSLDFYKSSTTDLLLREQVPVMNGYSSLFNNVGSTQNMGLELGVNSLNIQKERFSWSSSLNFAWNKNKITKLRDDGKDDLANAWLIGHPIRVFYDYKVIGIWQEADDIVNSHQPNAKPGDAKLADINGDGKITAEDRVVMGSKIPIYTLGFGNEFTYNNISLSIFMNGAFDVTKEDNFKNIERFLPNNGANYLADMNYWTPESPSSDIPSPGYTPVNNHSYYLNASYWRIRDVSLGYIFSGAKLDRFNISSIKAFINGRNLYTFTKVKGYNPEAQSVSSETGNPTSTNILSPYPSARTFSIGFNVQF